MKTYIVLDLEWNQSPDGKIGTVKAIPFEIIEIGAVKLDKNFNIIDEFRKIVKPVVYKKMHFKVHEVVQVGIEELRKLGEAFPLVANAFLSWCFKENETPIFCTWGSMDLTEFQRNLNYYKIKNVFPLPLLYYDIQKLYNIVHDISDISTNKMPLDKVCEALSIDISRPFHHALDDAYYTAMVMKNIDFSSVDKYLSLDYYNPPKNKDEELYLVFPHYSKYVSSTFTLKEDILKDKTVSDIICYRCNRMLRKKIHWFSSNQKTYYALGLCPEHGFVKSKLRMKYSDDNKIFAIKTTKLVTSDVANLLFEKKEEAKQKRREKNKAKRIKARG